MQAVTQGQELVIPVAHREEKGADGLSSDDWREEESPKPTHDEVLELIESLPRDLHRDKKEGQSSLSEKLETLQEEDEDLQIAWQYRASVQSERLGGIDTQRTDPSGTSVFCHSYDLNGKLLDQIENLRDRARTPSIRCCGEVGSCSNRACGRRYCQCLLDFVEPLVTGPKRSVVRLLLYRQHVPTLNVALPLFLSEVREKQWPVVVLITVQPWNVRTLLPLERLSDVVLVADCFATRREYPPPPEFRHLQGLLAVRKASTVTAATAHGGGHYADSTVTKRPAANLYGLKRDRRKLHIQLLHIPPEDYAEGGGSVGGGGVRSGAGRPGKKEGLGCASSGGSSLDF